ncbi:hypothetical protein G6F64_014236 [Rhizopus arrhizus]|uniref:Uncharacterized protein n=1 Tax=Rhizopus oryzae TaxID=64495 RepID=A0A9P7BJP9_RHIOR|nr:hypothetical protein G6F64_014236 [Rhizopus arrhizus]
MRGLATAGAQQTDRRRATVGGGRIEIVEHHVHVVEQVVLAQTDFIQVAPRQRADVEDDDVERSTAGRRREAGLQAGLLLVETAQPRIERVVVGGRQSPCRRPGGPCAGGRGGALPPVPAGRHRHGLNRK